MLGFILQGAEAFLRANVGFTHATFAVKSYTFFSARHRNFPATLS
jgi:hypothetical protein